jgi:nucleotide-binding universal stress UspA family protein
MRRALLAADASEPSLRAARTLARMARLDPDLLITVLHVVPLPEVLTPAGAAGAPLTLAGRMDDYIQTTVPEIFRKTLATLDLPEERVETRYVVGLAGDAILAEAREGGYDLIVMGRRGLSHLKEILVGSVSQAVIHGATCPVLLVP